MRSTKTTEALGGGVEMLSHEEYLKKHQQNNNVGWMYMISYWIIGLVIGSYFGYMPSWTSTTTTLTSFAYTHLFGLVATCFVAIPRIVSMSHTFGRSRSIITSSFFAFSNGICETMLFLAMYDLGAVWLSDMVMEEDGSSIRKCLAFLLGYLVLSIYAAPIHIKFWMPLAFPIHFSQADAKTFYKKGLPELQLMTISWLIIYATTNDINSVCILHMIFNYCGTFAMGLESPSLIKKVL